MKIKTMILYLGMICLMQPGFSFAQGNHTGSTTSGNTELTLERIIEKIEARYQVPGFQADFSQKSTIKAMDITDKAMGRIFVMGPDKMRWEYDEPEKQVIITNNAKLWVYRPEDNQVMVGKAPDFFGDGKGAGFLADISILRKKFNVSLEKSKNKYFYLLKLIPKAGTMELEKIYLSVSRATFKVMQVITYNAYGDKTRIDLLNAVFTQKPDPAIFNFTPPEGVDVLELAK